MVDYTRKNRSLCIKFLTAMLCTISAIGCVSAPPQRPSGYYEIIFGVCVWASGKDIFGDVIGKENWYYIGTNPDISYSNQSEVENIRRLHKDLNIRHISDGKLLIFSYDRYAEYLLIGPRAYGKSSGYLAGKFKSCKDIGNYTHIDDIG